MNIYINNFFFALNCLNIINNLKKILGQKYSIKNLRKLYKTIIR